MGEFRKSPADPKATRPTKWVVHWQAIPREPFTLFPALREPLDWRRALAIPTNPRPGQDVPLPASHCSVHFFLPT